MKRIILVATTLLLLICLLSACSKSSDNNNSMTEAVESTDFVVDSFDYNYYSISSADEYRLIEGVLYGRGYNDCELFGENSNDFYDSYVKIAENVIHFEAVFIMPR